MKTSYGLEFDTVTEINPEWSGYDKTIAGCHLANARVVIVDTEYGQPIDNEHDLEEIAGTCQGNFGQGQTRILADADRACNRGHQYPFESLLA